MNARSLGRLSCCSLCEGDCRALVVVTRRRKTKVLLRVHSDLGSASSKKKSVTAGQSIFFPSSSVERAHLACIGSSEILKNRRRAEEQQSGVEGRWHVTVQRQEGVGLHSGSHPVELSLCHHHSIGTAVTLLISDQPHFQSCRKYRWNQLRLFSKLHSSTNCEAHDSPPTCRSPPRLLGSPVFTSFFASPPRRPSRHRFATWSSRRPS